MFKNKEVKVLCDNVGAIFLSNNYESKRTKYFDVKYHFVREQVGNGIITIIFVSGVENKEDPFTNNVPESVLNKHTTYMITVKCGKTTYHIFRAYK